jgi:hypothetical protein
LYHTIDEQVHNPDGCTLTWCQVLYADASTTPDHPSLPPRTASLGVFFVNPQVQPMHTIYIKAFMTGVGSVLMAEAVALALAATVNDALNFNNTSFLSDCQQLVHFLNDKDQTNPLEVFANCSARRRSKIFKVNRNLISTTDNLAKQASSVSSSNSSVFDFKPVCSNSAHDQHCPVMEALMSINLNSVSILAARYC